MSIFQFEVIAARGNQIVNEDAVNMYKTCTKNSVLTAHGCHTYFPIKTEQ